MKNMKQLLILFAILFSAQTMDAQQTLRQKKENNLWGFVDTSGKVVIDFQYQNVHSFYGDVTLAQQDSLWGFINKKGEIVVPFLFSEVQKYLNVKIVRAKKEGFWYLYNLDGALLIKDKFEEISPVITNKMTVRKNGKSGLIDVNGKYLIKPKYEAISYFGGDMVRVKKRGKYGYRTTENKRAVPIKYEDIGRFYGTRAKAKRKGKWGIIDNKGKKILKFNFEYIGEYIYDSYLQDQYAPYVYGTRVGKITSWGASVPFNYEEIADETKRIDENLVLFRFGKDYGVVDNGGRVVINPFYKNPIVFSENVAAVTNGEKFGFIDKTGKIVYPLVLDKAENFVDGKAKVVKKGVEMELERSDLEM
jgi:hypothetical protein